jgi:AcrR family transcriptional regulator
VTSPPTARGRATRQAILDAAEAVFGELSYDRASVAEITRRAGVAQGTFYVYFPDKKAAFIELVRHLNHTLRETIAIAVDGLTDRREIERLGFRTFFDYVDKHRSLYMIVREAEFVDPAIYRWHYDTLAEGYVQGLGQARDMGQLRDDLDLPTMAHLLMGIAEFMGGRYVLREEAELSDEVFGQIMGFIERGIGYRDGDRA